MRGTLPALVACAGLVLTACAGGATGSGAASGTGSEPSAEPAASGTHTPRAPTAPASTPAVEVAVTYADALASLVVGSHGYRHEVRVQTLTTNPVREKGVFSVPDGSFSSTRTITNPFPNGEDLQVATLLTSMSAAGRFVQLAEWDPPLAGCWVSTGVPPRTAVLDPDSPAVIPDVLDVLQDARVPDPGPTTDGVDLEVSARVGLLLLGLRPDTVDELDLARGARVPAYAQIEDGELAVLTVSGPQVVDALPGVEFGKSSDYLRRSGSLLSIVEASPDLFIDVPSRELLVTDAGGCGLESS